MLNPHARSAIVVFDQPTEGGDSPSRIKEILVTVSADGESVMFALPNGEEWGCNQKEIAPLVGGMFIA